LIPKATGWGFIQTVENIWNLHSRDYSVITTIHEKIFMAKITTMPKVIFGNHSAVIVPRKDRDNICKFYCDVLGGEITKAEEDRDFIRLGEKFYIVFLYGDAADASEFLRSARSIWLEIQSDNVEEMRQRILDSGVLKLDIPDPHLYFQAPGGQCWKLVGINEDLSKYEGLEEGTDVAKMKEEVKGKDKK
jgi:hypothetical protein